mmetsp:Transcript_19126/g.62359  ORF Transcript_19126/g.62359 Transcript_19126/m.62359 type:complete len:125 (-) Transcript_19126:642-1016(-)
MELAMRCADADWERIGGVQGLCTTGQRLQRSHFIFYKSRVCGVHLFLVSHSKNCKPAAKRTPNPMALAAMRPRTRPMMAGIEPPTPSAMSSSASPGGGLFAGDDDRGGGAPDNGCRGAPNGEKG